ncbi:MAG: hypothetical protein OXT09_10320, partial [Myxococcales bacterium]|nr:hypothetical protein [Myxococcales bacterium]
PPPDPLAMCEEPAEPACLQCQRNECCEPLVLCHDDPTCICHMECHGEPEHEACLNECGPIGDEYERWLGCLEEVCAEAC